jgi:hypothetical protein
LTFDLRTGQTDSKRLTVTLAVAFSIIIAGALLFLCNTIILDYVSAVYNSDASPQGTSTSHFIQNDKKAATSNNVTIRTSDINWYTPATVDKPSKVIAGKEVNFVLELGDTSLSTNSIVVTITDNGGQRVLFFPRSHAHKLVDEVQFQYTFPLPGKYNVDITFGGPAAANFNVFVANSESVI